MEVRNCNLRKTIYCRDSESALKVAKKLKSSGQRHIFVIKNKKVIGIISTTDINNRLVAMGKDPKKTMARDIMTRNVLIKNLSDDLVPVYLEMLRKKVYSCPVVSNGKLKGILDLKEAMNHIIKIKAGS